MVIHSCVSRSGLHYALGTGPDTGNISGHAPEVGINQNGWSRGSQRGSMGCDGWDWKSKQRPDFELAGEWHKKILNLKRGPWLVGKE